MAESYLQELFEIAARIVQLGELEDDITDQREWKAAKREWEALHERFNELRAEYVDALLGGDASSDDVPNNVQNELHLLREEADPSWHSAIDYTQDHLMPYLTKEAGKSPWMRKYIKAGPWVAAAFVAIVYFGIAIFSGTPITQSLETREGIEQRAAAAKKVIRYDDVMNTRVRRGGWIKGILFWPIEPNATEIKGAGEFVGLVLAAQQYATGCGSVVGYGDTLTTEQLEMIGKVADIIQRDELQWEDPAPVTMVAALETVKPC